MKDLNQIISLVIKIVNEIASDSENFDKISEDMPLVGGDSVLDSMKLVELWIALEDKASALGFEFDWTSDTAMSKSRSMFRTAGTLIEEFINQSTAK